MIQRFEIWIYERAKDTYQNNSIGMEISDNLPLLQRLNYYVNDGCICICIYNNGVENEIRSLTLGRKNNLLCGNHGPGVCGDRL